ncbi:MAG: hybrid sensor histidine kinase/response regulator [Bacteroidia bacterium]|nr:hybrid sensor histidine kinase/response regulator [Bacteroidia bacterium]
MNSLTGEIIEEGLISILLIDDDEEDYLITRDIIEDINHKKFTVDWIDSYEEGIRIMSHKIHDVYLVDYRLGAFTGLDVLQHASEIELERPIILLTGQGDLEIDQLSTVKGASDYLVKNELTPDRLERSMRFSIKQYTNLLKIKQLNQDLEERVAARTDALAMAVQKLEKQIKDNKAKEEQLKKSEEELRKALAKEQEVNELKSRFVSMASHEFRTPLATILSSISLIQKYDKAEYQDRKTKHINRVRSNVHALNSILDDFLSLSKLEEGKISTHMEYVKLREMMADLQEEMNLQTKPGQKIILDYEGDEEYLWMDGHLIRNSLTNLLSNAIKYSAEESIIQMIGRVKDTKISITVKDEGIGVPLEEQIHLFERFFRARNVTHIKGTGLGLSIVKRYVDMLGGEITFHSVPNEGTSFTIHLSKRKPTQ